MRGCSACRQRIREMESSLLVPERRNPTRWFTGWEGLPDHLLETNSAKTSLGEDLGYLTGVMYLLPATQLASFMRVNTRALSKGAKPRNLCCSASAGCALGCLVASGQGGQDQIMAARARKTWLFQFDTAWFMDQLRKDIADLIKKAKRTRSKDPVTGKRRSMIPAVRLNGTSDILWENPHAGVNIVRDFPHVQFYDYTKYALKARQGAFALGNYDLTYSMSDNSRSVREAEDWLKAKRNVAVVWRTLEGVIDVVEQGRWKAPSWSKDYPTIDGDRDDLRFLDPRGVVVGLYAKRNVAEQQTQDPFGFFMERMPEHAAAQGWSPPPPHAVDTYYIGLPDRVRKQRAKPGRLIPKKQSPTGKTTFSGHVLHGYPHPVPAAAWSSRVTGSQLGEAMDKRVGRLRPVRLSTGNLPVDSARIASQSNLMKKAWIEIRYGKGTKAYAARLGPYGRAKNKQLIEWTKKVSATVSAGMSPDTMRIAAEQLQHSMFALGEFGAQELAMRYFAIYWARGTNGVRPRYRKAFAAGADIYKKRKNKSITPAIAKQAMDQCELAVGLTLLANYGLEPRDDQHPMVTFGLYMVDAFRQAAASGDLPPDEDPKRGMTAAFPASIPNRLKTSKQYTDEHRARQQAARAKAKARAAAGKKKRTRARR